jgi:hypothetical protein
MSDDHIHLGESFGLDHTQSQTKIKDLPAFGTWPSVANNINNAKARYPDAYGHLKYSGWTDEQFLNLSAFSAAWHQAVWSGQFEQWGAGIWSRVNIDVPSGDFYCTIPADKAMGQYTGAGPHLGWNPRQAATCLHVWKDQWQGKAGEDMYAMRSANWGKTDVGDAWMHAGSVDRFGFVGNNPNGWHKMGWQEHGLGLWDEGEASTIGRIYAADHNGYGVQIVRGTPFTANAVLSVFTNSLGGVGIIGAQLATIHLGTVSGDDNAAMIVMADGYGRAAGGSIYIANIKSESGKRPINHGQIVLWQRNPCVGNITIGAVQMDQNWTYNDAAFVMQSREWGQVMNVGSFVGWNFNTLVHDVTNKKRWSSSSYRPESFVYCSRNNGTVSDLTTLTMMPSSAVNASDRLGMSSTLAGFNYSTGTPTYSVFGPSAGGPTIDTFSASPLSISAPGTVTLAWQTTGASTVSISSVPGALPVDGATSVQVSATTTFTLVASGSGSSANVSVTVTLTPGTTGSTSGSTGSTSGSTSGSTGSTSGSTAPAGAFTELPTTGWVASAFRTNSTSESPAYVLDNNSATVWSSGVLQAPGHTFSLSNTASQKFDGILMESTWPQDFPRGLTIQSYKGASLLSTTNVVGTTSNMTVWLPSVVDADKVTFTLTASNPSYWWTIGKLRLLLSATGSTSGSTGSGSTGSTSGSTGSTGSTSGSTGSTSGSTSGSSGGSTSGSTASVISPSSVIVVVNSDDPNSAALATAYSNAWGIPTANKIVVSLGNAHCLSDSAKLTAARTAINNAGASKQFVALCFEYPSRYGTAGINSTAQSITSAITFGARSVSALTASVLYNYNGLTPFTTKGVRPSWIVLKQSYIRRAEHGVRPGGYLYGWAAKDQAGTARGTLRAPLLAACDARTNFEYVNLTQVPDADFNYGENPYNSPTVWAFDKFDELDAKYTGTYPQGDPRGTKINRPTAAKPLVAYFGSMYRIGTAADNVNNRINGLPLAKGWYGDHLTSFSGYLPDGAAPSNGQGQTPITWFLDCGASLSVGSVSEPWSGNPASTVAPQFVDPGKFLPIWQDQRLPGVIAAWASVQLADRALIAGDGMCAPFA